MGRVLRGAGRDTQDVLLAFDIDSYRTEHVMSAKALAVNVDHQDFDLIPPPLLQLLELLDASFNDLPADRAARHPYRFRHLRQDFPILTGVYAPQQGTQHMLPKTSIL